MGSQGGAEGGRNINAREPTNLGEQKAGGFLIIGWEGQDLSEALELLERFRPAGLIFFRRNYPPGGGSELRDQLSSIKERAKDLGLENLILALDNEGGLVRRLPEPHVQLPKATEWEGIEKIREKAKASGTELKSLGFNLNLAPVLDVDISGSFMKERCFGTEPYEALAKAEAFTRGFRDAGILCCGKHFPGLGAAVVDPHEALPVVSATLAELEFIHMAPFKFLLGEALPMAMTTHCLYPAIDSENPATFSADVLKILRENLDFDGPVLCDDLEMGAIKGVGEAAARSVKAGHDLVLVCKGRDNASAAAKALAESLGRGDIKPERLALSRKRVGKAFEALRLHDPNPRKAMRL